MKQAIIYIRVSWREQVQGFSLDSQEAECREWCEREGFLVRRVFSDAGRSAKSATTRAQFQAAIDHVKESGDIDAFVVINSDRFARNALDHLTVREMLAGYGCRLLSVTEQFEDTPAGRFYETVRAGLNQLDNEERTRKTVSGMAEACRQGYWVWRAPIGYIARATQGNKRRILEPDPERAPLVRDAFELYATGQHSQREVLRRITSRGLRTLAGKPLSTTAFRRMLQNPVYIARIRTRLLAQEVPGKWEPLIGRDCWQLVQGVVSNAGTSTPKTAQRQEFPLKGFVNCARCNRPLTAAWSAGKQGRKYPYYRCPKCAGQNVNAHRLHDLFEAELQHLAFSAGHVAAFRAMMLRQYDQIRAKVAAEKQAKAATRRNLEQQKERLLDGFLRGTIPEADYDRRRRQLDENLAQAIQDDTDVDADNINLRSDLELACKILLKPARAWRNSPHAGQVALQSALFVSPLVWDKATGLETPAISKAVKDLRALDGPTDASGSPNGPDLEHLARLVASLARAQRTAA
jgi:DNA invertase Pin-like site-specific DNA recombinase